MFLLQAQYFIYVLIPLIRVIYNSGSPAISGGLLDVNVCSAVYFTIDILLYILLLSLFYIFFLCRQKETKNSAHGTLS